MPINITKTGENIRKLAEEKGLSPVKLSEAINGISSVQAVYKWFNGSSLPSIDNFLELQRVLELDNINQLIICDRAEEEDNKKVQM